jgi:hypothetical protein
VLAAAWAWTSRRPRLRLATQSSPLAAIPKPWPTPSAKVDDLLVVPLDITSLALFDGVPTSYRLDLVSSTASRNGIVELQYRRHR